MPPEDVDIYKPERDATSWGSLGQDSASSAAFSTTGWWKLWPRTLLQVSFALAEYGESVQLSP